MNDRRRVLVCDDEPQILRAMKVVLGNAGFDVVPAATAAEAIDAVAVKPPDAAIIDLVLPDGDGVQVTEQIREWSRMPIIVLSAVGDEAEKVRALNAGADDYVTKPFGSEELIARLNAALRRMPDAPEDSVIEADGLEIDLAAHTVSRDGERGPPDADRVRPPEGARHPARPADHPRDAAARGLGRRLRGRHPGAARAHRQPAPQDRAGAGQPALHHHRPRRRLPLPSA